MPIYIVTETTGEYSQTNWCVKAVFDNREAAERYVAGMASLPGITGEYAPGREVDYDIEEVEVWDDAPERVMRYHISEIVGPDTDPRARPPYRTEEFYPRGYTDDLTSAIDTDGTPGWCTIRVTAVREEVCVSEYRRLLEEWRAAPREGAAK